MGHHLSLGFFVSDYFLIKKKMPLMESPIRLNQLVVTVSV